MNKNNDQFKYVLLELYKAHVLQFSFSLLLFDVHRAVVFPQLLFDSG